MTHNETRKGSQKVVKMSRKRPKIDTLKFVYAKSGNQCAFPDCNLPIYEDNGVLTGECCHIEAYSKGGARYNASTTEDEKNSESNLIMMCSRHHTIIDADCSTYSVDVLKQMKSNHEHKFSGSKRELDNKMLFALEQSIDKYWQRLQNFDDEDETGFKINIDTNAELQTLLDSIGNRFEQLEGFLSAMSYSDEKLPADLRELCERAGVDYSLFEQIPYWENSFVNRLWEIHSIGVPNISNQLKLYFLQFCVNIFAELSKHDSVYNDILHVYQAKLESHHRQNYYAD